MNQGVMGKFALTTSALAACVIFASGASIQAANYAINTEPLAAEAFIELPLGSVKPDGCLRNQLKIKAK